MAPLPGPMPKSLGKYELIEEIGRGSMGTVYSAHDPFSNRTVAIKVAHPEFIQEGATGDRFRKLFFNEARATGHLKHPNLLHVYDAGVENDLCFLVMEIVEGARTLEAYCKPDALLSVREVVGVIYKLAKALDYAHREGIIHRDIKPSNILLTRDRDVKLADFSIAMITRKDVTQTQFVGFLGSPLYMSPEQINEGNITNTSDIFSLGSVAYQLLTGRHPFLASNLNAINQKITHEEPTSINELRKELPDQLDYVLRRMLKKDPRQRYSMGLDLAADLAIIFEDLDAPENETDMKERFARVQHLGFFKDFSDSEIWELIRASDWQTVSKDTEIIREGDVDDSFYIVLSGVVDIEKNGRKIDALQDGDFFGEMGYLAQIKRSASVVARSEVSIMKVNAKTIDRAAQDCQLRFLKGFVRILIERLSGTTSALSQQH